MDERLGGAIERATGSRPVDWRPVTGGYTMTRRGIVRLDDGRCVFVKAANAEMDAGWLRTEHKVYSSVSGSFLPQLQGFDDDGELPVLVLDDLSRGFVVPPWSEESIAAVRAALDELGAMRALPGLPRFEEFEFHLTGWQVVADDPAPFLSLGLCSAAWLGEALPALVGAAESAQLAGDQLLHCDVRSDNIAVVDGQALFVDWNWACAGNALLDLAAWLPSLAAEGGPQPGEVFPPDRRAAGYASLMAGFWAARAALPPPPTADPSVRDLQRRQLAVAFDWAVRELGLPAPR